MQIPDLSLRAFNEGDARHVHDVAFEAWRFTYRDIYPAAYIREFLNVHYAPEQLKRLASGVAAGEVFFDVAEHRSRIVGFCHIGPTREGAELFRIYLLPEFIGQGIGGELLGCGEAFLLAREWRSYFCFVHPSNEIGKRFYENHGFRHLADRDADDGWYMEKSLG